MRVRSPARLLIVDDNPSKLLALESALAPLGVETVCVTSGREALRMLLHGDATVIILDVRMPEMDGFETAELIRAHPRHERTPILFVTAFDQAETDMRRGFALGAIDFVLSPIVPEILRNKVSVLVDLYEATAEVQRQSEELLRLETLRHRTRLARAETRRRRAEQRFSTILALAGDAILAIDDQERVVLFNQAAERIFRRQARGTVGCHVGDLIVGGANVAASLSAGERPASREVEGLRPDGTRFPAEATVSDIADGDRTLRTVILRDITERRENEMTFQRLHAALDERLRVGIDVVAAVAETLDAELVLDRVLVRAASALRAQRGTLLRLDVHSGRVKDARELNHAAAYDRAAGPESQPLLLEAMRTGRPVIASDVDASQLPAAIEAWGASPRHVAVVPLAAGEQVLALLLLCRDDETRFSAADVETLAVIANVAVVALRNADLYASAESSSKSKGDFLNMAAHELRTPVSVVRGYITMLADGSLGPVPSAWAHALGTVATKADELNRIVDDLLSAARADARQFIAKLEPTDLRELAATAAARSESRAGLLGGTVTVDVPESPVIVTADTALTGRILDNLVGNALTYTVGAPEVTIRVDAADHAVLVEDRGPGIPEQVRNRIFERFVRLDHPLIGPRPGTGLGLYIAHSLAVEQGATLALERTDEEGSVFRLAFQAPQELLTAGVDGHVRSRRHAAATR